MRKLRGLTGKTLLFGTIIFMVSSFAVQSPPEHLANAPIDPPFQGYHTHWVDAALDSLSLEEKIAQLLMIAAYPRQGEKHEEEISNIIKKYNVGGIIFFQGSPYRLAQMSNHFQSVAKTPLLIAIDGEWGLSMRLDSTVKYPRQMMLGAIENNRLIYDMGKDIAKQMKRLGIHMNFAPVVDVNNNPDNPVINSRSFGEDKTNVAYKSLAYMIGMQDNGVLATAKHFPGHGDTDTDSHHALPVITHTRTRIDSLELYPFKELINKGVSGVMIAHLNIPALDPGMNKASTLSKKIVTSELQDSLHFNGLVITDALNMGGVSSHNTPNEIAAKALLAGNDILLMPADVPGAIQAIKKEIENGHITEDEITRRCKKILMAKDWVGLDNYVPVELGNLTNDLNKPEYGELVRKLTENAITLVTNKEEIIPLKTLDDKKIASVSIGGKYMNKFQESLSLYAEVEHFNISRDAGKNEFDRLLENLSGFDLVIVGIQNTNMLAYRNFGITDNSIAFADKLAKKTKTVLCVFANPYSLKFLPDPGKYAALIMAYQDEPMTNLYTAQLIFGGILSKGKLPVSVGEKFPYQSGILTSSRIRFKYTIPGEVNMKSEILARIDSIAQHSIDEEAFPGCQVLVARHGKVVYHKAFGHHTYLKKKPVSILDIYDLASITKIVASLATIMKLEDEGKFDINKTLGDYLELPDTCNKDTLVIKDILLHQAQLYPWIPFYMMTLRQLHPGQKKFQKALSNDYPFKLSESVYMNRNLIFVDSTVDVKSSADYPYEAAKNFYIHRRMIDSMYYKIYYSELTGYKGYRYSDLGYYMLLPALEKLVDTTLDAYVKEAFYDPLGAYTMGFCPTRRFEKEQLVPTENDIIFRKQLIHGYVHDPGAAMLGGVCGHAGVFSNANDLAKMMQMFLDYGQYAGKRYIDSATIAKYSACPNCKEGTLYHNRRGIGFDKPEKDPLRISPAIKDASRESYGHTGFTGTYAWVDPTNGLLYVFLSNRIHPNQENLKIIELNTRTDIMQVAYDAIVE